MKKFLNWLKSPSSDFVLFVLLLILANIAGYNASARFDLTSPKSYSLSKESKTLVKNIDKPLSVRVFFDEKLPAPYNSVAQYVKDILTEYSGAANKNFSVSFMDMTKDENKKLAEEYGLRQVQIQEVKNNEVGFTQTYMGLAISYGDNVSLLDPVTTTDGFEYKFTSKLSKMINAADVLTGLGEKVSVTLYMSEGLKNIGIENADIIEDYVRKAVDSLNEKNLDAFEFNCVSPRDESEAKDLLAKYGIQGMYYGAYNGMPTMAVFGLVVEYGEKFRVLPLSIQQDYYGYVVGSADNIEEDIVDGMQSVMSKVTKIGYITGHNELDHYDETYSANFDRLVSDMYELVDLNLVNEDIPAGMNSIIINGPQYDFEEIELYKIDQFIMGGGNVMFFVDSMSQDGMAQFYGSEQFVPNDINLDRILSKYGIKRDLNYIMDTSSFEVASPQTGKYNMWWAPQLQKEQLDKKHPITANLGYVIFLQNGSIDASEAQANENLKTTVLAKSTNKAWAMDKGIMLNPVMLVPPSDESVYKSYDLAVLVEGKFNSAFDGPVKAPVYEYDEEGNAIEVEMPEGDIETTSYISSGILPGKIVVIGSSYVTTRQLIDAEGSNPVAMMIMNIVDYLNGNEELCRMRTKGLSLNTITVKNAGIQKVWQYFNQFGLAVIVVIIALIVWRIRSRRRKAINKKYNPNDTRTIKKNESEEKNADSKETDK